jgi:hypothetical protein
VTTRKSDLLDARDRIKGSFGTHTTQHSMEYARCPTCGGDGYFVVRMFHGELHVCEEHDVGARVQVCHHCHGVGRV